MPTVFEPADADVRDLIATTIERYFPEIHGLEEPVTFDVQMATDEKGEKPPLKRHGHPCAAIISITKPEERVKGTPDVRLKIAKVRWEAMDGETRVALLHHEISHLVPKYDKDTGSLKLDPYGRPVVKCRPDDFMPTGFYETIRIFGAKALEWQSLTAIQERISQRDFGFMAAESPDQSAVIARVAELDRTTAEEGDDEDEDDDEGEPVLIPARGRRQRAAMSAAE
jgi:hypothetical protein